MPYLVLNDYSRYIQPQYLSQLVQGDQSRRIDEEKVSVQAILQRLEQKYDLNAEFTDTLPYSTTRLYPVAARVTVDTGSSGFTTWTASTTYTVGALVIYNSVGYSCKTDNTDATFTPSKWYVVAPQHTIFYVAYPAACTLHGQPNPATLTDPYAPEFNYKNLYDKGDVVFWKGYTYTCNQPSTLVPHQALLQYVQYTNTPYSNVFPDDPVNNASGQYWNNKTAVQTKDDTITGRTYDADAGTYEVGDTIMAENGDILSCIEDIPDPAPFAASQWVTLWVKGDNRNQTVKDAMVRITVFKLSPLIAPKNVPAMWFDDYRDILRELNAAAAGEITMNLPRKQPYNATRTYHGGNVKQVNNY